MCPPRARLALPLPQLRRGLDVIQQRDDTYEELARIPTIEGARTALFVPERDRLYLAVRASGGEGAAVWVFRATP